MFYLLIPLDFGLIPILLPGTAPQPMTAEYVDQIHSSVYTDAGIYIPAVLKELARKPEYLERMKHMSWVGFGGAPLDPETGAVFSSFLRVQPLIGSTEVGGYGTMLSDRDDWMYYEFSDDPGFRFDPYQDDLYESVIVRRTKLGEIPNQLVFNVFPDFEEYHTKDVWRKHPTKQNLWLMCGRTDDFVKLATLTKFNASHVESLVLKDPAVKAAVMGGEGKKVPFLLVELADQDQDDGEALKTLWPAIEKINGETNWEIKLNKEMILFAKKGKPLRRVMGKGTTNRRATVEEYAAEIEKLYQSNTGLTNDRINNV
jgi:hypothetical protein